MKEKILNKLKTLNQSIGLSDKTINVFADMLVNMGTTDENLDSNIEKFSPIFIASQSEVDSRVNQARDKWMKEQKPAETKPLESNKPADGDEIPAWMKAFTAKYEKDMEEVRAKAGAYEAAQATKAREELFYSKAKQSGIPQYLLAGRQIPETEEEINNQLALIKDAYSKAHVRPDNEVEGGKDNINEFVEQMRKINEKTN